MKDADGDADANPTHMSDNIIKHSHMYHLHMAVLFVVYFSFKQKEVIAFI